MKNLKFNILATGLLLSMSVAQAQTDIYNSKFASSTLNNPAFTGHTGRPTATVLSRMQWVSSVQPFNVHAGMFETPILGPNSNFGAQFITDAGATRSVKTNTINFSYSHSIPLSKVWTMRAGLAMGFSQRILDHSGAIYEDQLDPRVGLVQVTQEDLGRESKSGFNVNAGLVFHTKKLTLAATFNNLARPDLSFYTIGKTTEFRSPVRYGFLSTYRFDVPSFGTNTAIYPTVGYNYDGFFHILDLGANIQNDLLFAGVNTKMNFEGNMAIGGTGGFNYDNFRLGYSLMLTPANETRRGSYTHEFVLQFMVGPKPTTPVTWSLPRY